MGCASHNFILTKILITGLLRDSVGACCDILLPVSQIFKVSVKFPNRIRDRLLLEAPTAAKQVGVLHIELIFGNRQPIGY